MPKQTQASNAKSVEFTRKLNGASRRKALPADLKKQLKSLGTSLSSSRRYANTLGNQFSKAEGAKKEGIEKRIANSVQKQQGLIEKAKAALAIVQTFEARTVGKKVYEQATSTLAHKCLVYGPRRCSSFQKVDGKRKCVRLTETCAKYAAVAGARKPNQRLRVKKVVLSRVHEPLTFKKATKKRSPRKKPQAAAKTKTNATGNSKAKRLVVVCPQGKMIKESMPKTYSINKKANQIQAAKDMYGRKYTRFMSKYAASQIMKKQLHCYHLETSGASWDLYDAISGPASKSERMAYLARFTIKKCANDVYTLRYGASGDVQEFYLNKKKLLVDENGRKLIAFFGYK